MLRGFGCEQLIPTEIWEDNAACIQIANNLVRCAGPGPGLGYDSGQVRQNAQRRRRADQKPSGTGLDDASSLADWDTQRVQGILRVPWHHGDIGCGLGLRLGVSAEPLIEGT
eukprot:1498968-Rhodomonas_salina.1